MLLVQGNHEIDVQRYVKSNVGMTIEMWSVAGIVDLGTHYHDLLTWHRRLYMNYPPLEVILRMTCVGSFRRL